MLNQTNRDSPTPAPASPLTQFSAALRSTVKTEMEAVIFVGIQGCGKSSFFKEHFAASHLHINLDTLKTRKREDAALEAILEQGKAFVVDNTNASIETRRKYIEQAKAKNFRVVCYYFDVPLKEALARNAQRTGKAKVPVPGIISTYKRLELPTPAEGFDQIFKVTLQADGGFAVEPMKRS